MARHDGPDRAASLEQYRRVAPGYDRRSRWLGRWQRAAVERLELPPGGTVLDVACGTGLNFERLLAKVGSGGRVIGIDPSPDMLARARQRVAAHGWRNVTLVEAAAEDARVDGVADGALFSFSHDVLQSPEAVANVVRQLRPGASVASVGPKLAARWQVLTNFAVRRIATPFVTTFEGLDRPWRHLERHTEGLEVRSLALGGAYVAWGRISAEGHSGGEPAV